MQAVNDTMLIYYRLAPSDDCTDNAPISLGDFIKKTLPNEWVEGWGDISGGVEALKAGAVAIRTFTISSYHAEIINIGGQNYYCTKAWRQFGFDPTEIISSNPNAEEAVDGTSGIILSHPNASPLLGTNAIDAQYRDETGVRTLQGYQDAGQTIPLSWLTPIYDPISTGFGQTGMGQEGTRRWAWGENDNGLRFPQWDYRRILAHYYSEVEFDGAITPNPPEALRAASLPINYFITAERGKPTSVIIMNECN